MATLDDVTASLGDGAKQFVATYGTGLLKLTIAQLLEIKAARDSVGDEAAWRLALSAMSADALTAENQAQVTEMAGLADENAARHAVVSQAASGGLNMLFSIFAALLA